MPLHRMYTDSGKYDEVILKYLMEYRFGPVDELISVWKSAQGFEMDTYELEEKLLGLLMFTSDYRKEGEKILEDYVHHSGRNVYRSISYADCIWCICKRISDECFCKKSAGAGL